jgi:hypothetical protein
MSHPAKYVGHSTRQEAKEQSIMEKLSNALADALQSDEFVLVRYRQLASRVGIQSPAPDINQVSS